MNHKLIISVVGKAMIIEAILMLFPLLVGVYYGENDYLPFAIPILGLAVVGVPLSFLSSKDKSIYAKEGIVIVAICWVVLSLVGALPFVISKEIPNYIDALFETISGFSTTGASILENVDVLSKSIMFWRVLTHFIGGMGVLVFIIAILPAGSSGAMHIFRAESPGPSSTKIVGNLKITARILYAIYIGLTFIEFILLLFSKIGIYDSLLTALSTAGTGGFGLHNGSIAYYNNTYIEMVIAVFMFLFGINFNVFYLAITGNILKGLKSEEFITYVLMILTSIIIISINLLSTSLTFVSSIRYAFFQVASISSTTGFTTATIEEWPALSKGILFFLSIVGASGGSTGGGMKVARLAILCKSCSVDVRKTINPRSVVTVKYEGKPLSTESVSSVRTFLILYCLIVLVCTFILSFDGYGNQNLFTHISASIACVSNVGPGLTSTIGALGSYSGYSAISKIVLSVAMLFGRLEIMPMLLLFAPRTWRKG